MSKNWSHTGCHAAFKEFEDRTLREILDDIARTAATCTKCADCSEAIEADANQAISLMEDEICIGEEEPEIVRLSVRSRSTEDRRG